MAMAQGLMSRALSPRAGFHPSGFEDWLQASCCGVIAFSGRMRRVPRAGDVASPYGTNKKNFMAAFSNIDSEIDLTGPGVEILSTVPNGYAPLDGTSMAAKILSALPNIVALPRNQARSDAMARAVLQAAKSLGFGPTYEGQGLL
jgi:subtilisin family serine protease